MKFAAICREEGHIAPHPTVPSHYQPVFQLVAMPDRNKTGMLLNRLIVVSLLVTLSVSVRAATWYVDSSVASSGDGTSWATAWKNVSNIGSVSAGDTVYFSGGPSGSSQT